jgi:hypothetical protein
MALRAKKPEAKEKRLKMLMYGSPGVGKTTASIQFPNSYIIDTEKGTDFYNKTITKSGSVVLQTLDIDEIKAEIKELLTTNHEYKTLIIDPITKLYESVQQKWTGVFERYAKTEKEKEVGDFGLRYWGKVKSDWKELLRLILNLDMNVIITSHQKIMYGLGMTKIGDTFDSMKGDDYFYDYMFQLVNKGNKRVAVTMKERAEIGENKFPEEFEWSYANFVKFYGKEILEKEATKLEIASKEDIQMLKNLIETLNISEDVTSKWLAKADVENFSDMPKDMVIKCIKFCEDKIKSVKGE